MKPTGDAMITGFVFDVDAFAFKHGLTSDEDSVSSVAWAQYHFGALCTGRTFRRATAIGLEKRGLIKSLGHVARCDDDGFTILPERYSEGFALTPAGLELAYAAGSIYARMIVARACGDLGSLYRVKSS